MIDSATFNRLREFEDWSSWAIWAPAGATVKSNTEITSIFDDENLLSKLNDKYIFVGLNASRQVNNPWSNFHSQHRGQNDYKLRFAFQGTRFWGSYLTDVFKGNEMVEKNSNKFLRSVTDEMVYDAIQVLEKEIAILRNPTIIAFGDDVFRILSKNLDEIDILKIRHYSSFISKENYRKEVLDALINV